MNKKMFNIMILIAGIFFVCLFSNVVSAQEINYTYNYQYDGVQVTSLKYEPYPANPGEYFDIWIQATLGRSTDYVKFELVEEFPFSVDDNENTTRIYEDFSGEVLIHYKVRVDENAVEGINPLKVKIITSKVSTSGIISSFDINIAEAQTDFDLVIQDSTTSEVSIAIANIGKNTANSMIVRIPDQEGYIVSGTNGQMVGNLESGDYSIVSFSVSQIGKSASDLTVEIDYTDSIGERRTVLKQVQINSQVSLSNSTGMPSAMSGSFAGGEFPQQGKTNSNNYIKIGILLIVIVALIFVYFKYSKKIKESFKKINFKKKNKVGSSEIPSWVKNFKEK